MSTLIAYPEIYRADEVRAAIIKLQAAMAAAKHA